MASAVVLLTFFFLTRSALHQVDAQDFSLTDPRCPPVNNGTRGTCSFCSQCKCGEICCPNGCGTSCVRLPNPPELHCLISIRCFPRECGNGEATCPGVPGARCSPDCNCDPIFIGCNGEILTDEQCNPAPTPSPEPSASTIDPRCQAPIGSGTCAQCTECPCGQICCPNGCGSSCVRIPLPTELACLASTTCLRLQDCEPGRDCPGVPGASCTLSCECGKAFLGCDGELLTEAQCNPVSIQTCPPPLPPDANRVVRYVCRYNGRRTLNGDVNVGTICSARCPRNYELRGVARTRCMSNGRWNPEIGRSDCFSLTPTPSPEPPASTIDPRCQAPIGSGTCAQCTECPCGQICCPNGCGSSCIHIPLPTELACLTFTTCPPLQDCKPGRDCPGVPGASCTHSCECGKAFLDCNGKLLTEAQCNPVSNRTCPSPLPPDANRVVRYVCRYNGPRKLNGDVNVGTICFARCPRNYELRGVARTRCMSNGRWNPEIGRSDCFPLTNPSDECLPGVDIAYCLIRPCQFAKCPAVRNATCSDNYCGGCEAVFTTPDGIVLTEEECKQDCKFPPLIACFIAPCRSSTCPNYPEATCRPGRCNSCSAVFTYRGFILTNDDCHKARNCPSPVDPTAFITFDYTCTQQNRIGSTCTATCSMIGKAILGTSQITCGRDGQWSPSDFTKHQCVTIDVCPPGSPQVLCKKPPCLGASCPAYHDAVCRNKYCGSCSFEFYRNGNKLSREECNLAYVPPCPSPVNPARYINFQYSCTNQNNVGSSCTASCLNRQELLGPAHITCAQNSQWEPSDIDDNLCINLDRCPPNLPPVKCVKPPCLGMSCPAYVDAVCRDNYCGGCFYDFYQNGRKLSREECDPEARFCPSPINPEVFITFHYTCTQQNRIGSTCIATCPSGQAILGTSQITCGQDGQWSPSDFRKTQCIAIETCPPGSSQVRCGKPPCMGANCPAIPDATCTADLPCRFCGFLFYYNGRKLNREQCIVKGPCPLQIKFCQRRCKYATCNGHPNAVCLVNCNCQPEFYDPTTLERVFCLALFQPVT